MAATFKGITVVHGDVKWLPKKVIWKLLDDKIQILKVLNYFRFWLFSNMILIYVNRLTFTFVTDRMKKIDQCWKSC